MQEAKSFDWTTDVKEVSVRDWKDRFAWVEEPYVSPDGETIASIVNIEDGVFTVCENGETWENEYDKIWGLHPLVDGRFAAMVSSDEEWTLSIGGREWENWFDFIWDLKASRDGSSISLTFQKDMEYAMAVNDTPWNNTYENINEAVLGSAGTTAAAVQIGSMAAADVNAFQQGLFSCAVNGKTIDKKFLNVWDISIDSAGKNVAYGARTSRTDYVVAVNDIVWDTKFQSVWKPVFIPGGSQVIAPVKTEGRWMLYRDGEKFWKTPYSQLWKLRVAEKSGDIAAIACVKFGVWTIVENDRPWNMTADQMISDLFYSDDGSTLVAVLKDRGFWTLAVNQKKWNLMADKVFDPCISADGSIVAAAIEKQGRYFLAVNNRILPDDYEFMACPVISPDNGKLILKTLKNGVYRRSILSVDKIL
jgi:hypothetical protein